MSNLVFLQLWSHMYALDSWRGERAASACSIDVYGLQTAPVFDCTSGKVAVGSQSMEQWSPSSICLGTLGDAAPSCWAAQCAADGTMAILSPDAQQMRPCPAGEYIQMTVHGVEVPVLEKQPRCKTLLPTWE